MSLIFSIMINMRGREGKGRECKLERKDKKGNSEEKKREERKMLKRAET